MAMLYTTQDHDLWYRVCSVGDMNWLLRHVTKMYSIREFFLRLQRASVLETEGLAASQPVSKKLGGKPALSF